MDISKSYRGTPPHGTGGGEGGARGSEATNSKKQVECNRLCLLSS